LSLSPESGAEPLPPPGRGSVPARTSPASQPTRIASAPSGGGGYLVQVSSQRSEADAQSAYRSLRAKYPSVLGDHQHVIRRADLGSRGVFYRAMVGPFGSREEAIQVCGNLKAAGGDCVVQSN
jgi:cell division septation protein DedD